ncbi:hypothetical protein BKI52_12795 [marine bacterium AO1-C]|nr:hypothetical protein BKI52_12795 [marine bacterium AO1-C]
MFKNYLKIALRNLLRNKLFSVLNILGLVLGMVACILILQYVSFEMSHDSFHQKGTQIYRVNADDYQNGKLVDASAMSYLSTGEMMVQDFPEVEDFVAIMPTNEVIISHQEKRFRESLGYFAGPSFFNIFSFNLLKGDARKVLSEPGSIVITKKMAQKYFANENPVGKALRYNDQSIFKVTGIVEAPPANSHLQFDFILSNQNVRKHFIKKNRNWTWGNFYTYVTLKPKTNPTTIEAQFPQFLKKHLDPEDFPTVKLHLQSIKDIHLNADLSFEPTPTGDKQALYLLVIIAVAVLIIAWINYVNLATARATHRAKEVGIRKVVGAYRKQLIIQFLGEAFFINLLACLLTILLVDYITPLFEHFTGRPIEFNLWQSAGFWLTFGGILITGVLISGLYPAFVLSSFKPTTVLKGKMSSSPKGILLRRGLTLFQFTASIVLIGSTIAVFQQLRFMRSQDLGMNIDQTLIVEAPQVTDSTTTSRHRTFIQKVQQLASVKTLSASSSVPGEPFQANMTGIRVKGQTGEGTYQSLVWADDKYLSTYQLKLIAGNNFSKKSRVKRNKSGLSRDAIINESSAKVLGFRPRDIIGKRLQYGSPDHPHFHTVVGVVADFHQASLKQATGPMIMFYDPEEFTSYYSIKLNTDQIQTSLTSIKASYLDLFPKNIFQYHFMDVAYEAQYKADQRFGEMFTLFSGLAIFVACMGLFGLTSFTLIQRTKELGIRKVLGASGASLMRLLLGDFLKPIVIAGLVALPILYWGIQQWLQNFAYRMHLNIWLFALPLLLIALIALCTIGFQTLKATQNNPVDALRYE